MSAGMIVVAIGMMTAGQAAVLAIAFSSFMGRSFLKHVEKAAAKQRTFQADSIEGLAYHICNETQVQARGSRPSSRRDPFRQLGGISRESLYRPLSNRSPDPVQPRRKVHCPKGCH